MNSASPTPLAGRDTPAARPAPDTLPTTTPNADMQADDVGTADSGTAPPDSGTAATRSTGSAGSNPPGGPSTSATGSATR